MVIPVQLGTVKSQRPDIRTVYSLGSPETELPTISRLRPAGAGYELLVELDDHGHIVVQGGLDGARYGLVWADGRSFQVKVSSSAPVPSQQSVATVRTTSPSARFVVEGDTAPIDVTLYDGDGAARQAMDGTGRIVSLLLRDRSGMAIPTAVDWLMAERGTVRYIPAANHLVATRSPYSATFKVQDVDGGVASYPSGHADTWTVRR